jgi:hypothetical protein
MYPVMIFWDFAACCSCRTEIRKEMGEVVVMVVEEEEEEEEEEERRE